MEYFEGDIVRIIHTDSGMQFPECEVYIDRWMNPAVVMMAQVWSVKDDETFKSLYPNFHLELVERAK